ncbi:hypothetical protein AB0H57_09890 [Micromonospora sp. NPDC050686]|uniref:hypothetical protein n=1 Tax=Micromonospora sp. NPDC050686 TaxID=3154631 RepID=UPI0033DA543C
MTWTNRAGYPDARLIGHDRPMEARPEESDFVSLEFVADDDGTGQLRVSARSNGYAGRGAAYFDALRLAEFAASLEAFPLPVGGLTLAGGFVNPNNAGELEQELVGLRFYGVGGRGQVGVGVHLSGEEWPHIRPESVPAVRSELLTTYERLRMFSRDFFAVARGDDVRAFLKQEVLL